MAEETDNLAVFDPDRLKPHAVGDAACRDCGHTWVAVVLANNRNSWFECPKCHMFRGRFVGPFVPKNDEASFECRCGNHLFYMLPIGELLCPMCGQQGLPDLPPLPTPRAI